MRRKVLAVDDSNVMLRLFRETIESIDYEPLLASGGAQALELIAHHADSLALILLDWNMPDHSGLEVLQELMASERHRRIPVLMVTTRSDGTDIIRAIRAGAKHYLIKPFTQQDLVTRMAAALGLGLDEDEDIGR